MGYWMVPPLWAGETAFIVAGGPSLRKMDLSGVPAARTIVINDSFRLMPDAAVLYFCDERWWRRNKSAVQETFRGRYIVTLENQIDGVKRLRNTGKLGLETDPAALRHGCNSGYQAINLAYHLGARRIVLLGYDMSLGHNGRTHWHGGHPTQTSETYDSVLRNRMLPCFDSLVEPLRQVRVEVINATPGSRLRCWPRVDLSTVLRPPQNTSISRAYVRSTVFSGAS